MQRERASLRRADAAQICNTAKMCRGVVLVAVHAVDGPFERSVAASSAGSEGRGSSRRAKGCDTSSSRRRLRSALPAIHRFQGGRHEQRDAAECMN